MRYRPIQLLLFPVLLFTSFCGPAVADSERDIDWGALTLFGQAAHSEVLAEAPGSYSEKLSDASLDLLYTGGSHTFPILAEYFYDSEDSDRTQLNRIQLGWRPTETTTLWLGKFNNPNEYWRDRYHDGLYFSPSVTAPFESALFFEGGVTASQLSGVRFEQRIPVGDSEWLFSAVVADGPNVLLDENADVDPDDFFTDFDSDQLLYSAGISYIPDIFSTTEFGIRYSEVDAPWDAFDFTGYDFLLEESILNVYANWQLQDWRILLSHSRFKQDLAVPAELLEFVGSLDFTNPANAQYIPFAEAATLGQQVSGSVDLTFLHLEYRWNDQWLAYGRYEHFRVDADPETLPVLEEFGVDEKYNKHILGLRYDFEATHALSLQYSNYRSTISDQEQSMLHLVWSFAWEVVR